MLLDDDEQIRDALAELRGIDADAIVDRLDDPEVDAAYERDKAEARNARGTAIETQGKASTAEPGVVRYTAPSIVFERDRAAARRRRLATRRSPTTSASRTSTRRSSPHPPPETPAPLLERFPDGLTTAEVAALLAQGPDHIPDLDAAEQAMVKLVADGVAVRRSLGSDPLWLPGGERKPAAEHADAA